MMRLLVTGGCGFIGSNFIWHILNKYPDYSVINLDKLTYAGNLENTKSFSDNSNYKFVQGDICDPKIVDDVMSKVDVVLNFAAESHVDNSISSAREFGETNFIGTLNLLEHAKKHGVRFVQISTDEVYGSIKKGSFTEASPLEPNSPYSSSKAAADLLVQSYIATHKMDAVITRSSNNYGPHQHVEKLIPLFITNLLKGKKLPLYGDGSNVRDWIYVLDNCEAIDLIMHKGESGKTYNIGGDNELANIEITKLILQELGKDESHIDYVEDRKGHDFRYSLSCDRLKSLGWKPRKDFKTGMKETIQWYGNNEWWWK